MGPSTVSSHFKTREVRSRDSTRSIWALSVEIVAVRLEETEPGSVDTQKKEYNGRYSIATEWQVCTDVGPLYSLRSLQTMVKGVPTLADMRVRQVPTAERTSI